jgi:hypothetical protein
LNGGKLVLTDNTTLTFDGDASPLILLPGSQVICGNNSKIEFKNGAHLRADSCTFTSTGSWQGITFENSTYDTITYCTFSGASTYLDWQQDNSSHNYIKKVVGNTFNNGRVRLGDVSRILIQDNKFTGNTSYTGNLLEVDNSITFSPAPSYAMNIINNEFKSGAIQLKLNCYNSQRTPFYVYGNHFYGLSGTSRVGLYAYNISGTFKVNTFEDSYYGVSALLKNTNLNFLANTLKASANNNIELTLGSVGTLEPTITATFIPSLQWIAGRNAMYQDNTSSSSRNSNCYFAQGNVLLTDKGQNCYNRYNDTSNYHIIGNYDCEDGPSSTLNARGNYWNTTPPRFILDCGVTLDYGNPFGSNCSATRPSGSYNVSDMGSGIYDSLFYEPYEEGEGDGGGKPGAGGLSEIPEDDELYGSMVLNSRLKNYSEAIGNAKDIINEHGTSRYLLSTLDGLYMSYHLSDTSSQSNTNSLFTALRSYLEDKMEQYDTNLAITNKAYGYYIMCLVKMKEYSAAISAYENIMNNHPDPEARLAASWDRASVVLMMNGEGGSYSSVTSKSKKLNDRKPDRIAKKTYNNAAKHADDNISKNVKYIKEDKELISQRVSKFNPSTHKEFNEKVSADILMLIGLGNTTEDNNKGNIPVKYELHQNYPNPFNPLSTIRYEIPKDAFITMKIYDILGREVFSRNEFKKAGSYELKFDGTNFASGVYFYSFEANGFKDTKKMVLIK